MCFMYLVSFDLYVYLLLCIYVIILIVQCYYIMYSTKSFYLAKLILAFCPPESEAPLSPITVCSPFGNKSISLSSEQTFIT